MAKRSSVKRIAVANMSFDEKIELIELLEETALSDSDRRERRFRAAHFRLWGVDDKGQPRLTGLAEVIAKARNGGPLTRDEFIVVSFGFLPGEFERMKAKSEWCA
jgi:hypothetical protein